MPLPKPHQAKNRVRIIGGAWRSRVLAVADAPGLRPTGDRIRETLFNWLGQTLHDQHCLDAFAGSGALGFEAASRAAASVVLCETHRAAYTNLLESLASIGASACEVINSDVFSYLNTTTKKFDLVFCDPPFAAQLHDKFLTVIVPHLALGGQVYVECDRPLDTLAAVSASYQIVKSGRAGSVYYGLVCLAARL